jgi:predicted CoA-substrate-specific enzyme activase
MKAALERLLVRGAIRAYIRKNKPRSGERQPARQRVHVQNARMLLDMYGRRGAASVLAGFLVPAELLHAYGTSPMFTENLAATIAGTGRAQRVLEHAEMLGYSRDGCSFHRATLGAGLAGLLPRFDLIVATSHLCDGQNKALEELADRTRAPYMLLDTPCDCSPPAVEYLAAQLEQLEDKLAASAGARAHAEDWERIFRCSNETRAAMIRLAELRRNRPCPFHGRAAFSLAFQSLLMMGTPFLRDCYQDLLRETAGMRKGDLTGERYRIGWLLSYPYFPDNFIPHLTNEQGVRVVAEEFSHVYWDPLDPAQPMKSLARKMLQNPNLGPVTSRVKLVEQMARDCKLDGVLHYSHWGCRQGCGGVRPISDALRHMDVPFLDLDGDGIDNRNYAKGATLTRIQGFLELMEKRKAVTPAAAHDGRLFLGLDIGSLTAKAVVISHKGEMLFETVILTGASSRKAIAKLREMIQGESRFKGRIDRCVATGYGRNAVEFADRQVTEISCHARGIAHLMEGVRTIIDIGGQDTKVIAVEEDGRVCRFSMNDKCAAGTGRFLEMMARTLEIDIDDLGPQALAAKRTVAISSMCTVFAESEIVSLIAEGIPLEEICRGVCDAIAARTVALLERIGREKKIAMSGGVAKNAGVVSAIERALGARLELPAHPQIAGALGAALIARDADS